MTAPARKLQRRTRFVLKYLTRPRPSGQTLLLAMILTVLFPNCRVFSQEPRVSTPPASVRKTFSLAPFYKKYLNVEGLPVVSSSKVSDHALLEAAFLIRKMIGHRPDVFAAMRKNRTRLAIMAVDELTTQIPEHRDLTPSRYWDRRARGLGATPTRPAVSCGEENLLGYPGDPYKQENILIHEFAHAIHEMGLRFLDKTFDERLQATFDTAVRKGLFQGFYAGTNPAEYWAEGVQSWFDTNRENDSSHNHVNTREELKEYDPGLAALIEPVFGDTTWRYKTPGNRSNSAHLIGYDPISAPTFAWPRDLEEWYEQYEREKRTHPAKTQEPEKEDGS